MEKFKLQGNLFRIDRGIKVYVFDNPLNFSTYKYSTLDDREIDYSGSNSYIDESGAIHNVSPHNIALPVYTQGGGKGLLYFIDIFDASNNLNKDYNYIFFFHDGFVNAENSTGRLGIDFSGYMHKLDLSSLMPKKLSTRQISDIVKNKIILGCLPDLHKQTCMGGGGKGFDKDPNTYSGEYLFADGNIYSVSRRINVVSIYRDDKRIAKFEVDYVDLKNAKIISSLRRFFIRDVDALSKSKDLEAALFELYKNNDEFKLSTDFNVE